MRPYTYIAEKTIGDIHVVLTFNEPTEEYIVTTNHVVGDRVTELDCLEFETPQEARGEYAVISGLLKRIHALHPFTDAEKK